MIIDADPRWIRPDAFSGQPGMLMDARARSDLAALVEIDLIENGDREARAQWQGAQLVNLLRHAAARSPFWRKRIISSSLSPGVLNFLPILSRDDVVRQVREEGSLMPAVPGSRPMTYASSGSTGTPVAIFATPQNIRYNSLRNLAQIFIDRLDLSLNRVHVQFLDGAQTLTGKAVAVEGSSGWLGSLDRIFRSGSNRKIGYVFDRVDALIEELSHDPVGLLVCAGGHMDNLLQHGGTELLKRLGVRHWIQLSDGKDAERCRLLAESGIPTQANYSSAEVGPIGFECSQAPFHYHVATSNVIVETDRARSVDVDGALLSPILVTHLHSYATPIIRYDIGDMGILLPHCPCGHAGPTLTEIFGRRKMFLRHADGRLSKFYFVAKLFRDILDFTELSFRQVSRSRILLQIRRNGALSGDEEDRVRKLLSHWFGAEFQVTISVVSEIDWRGNTKRLLFVNDCED